MPASKDQDRMEIPQRIFQAEELVFRFRCMPDSIQEFIMQDQEKVQELVQAIYEYKEYFSHHFETERAADDRLYELLGEASKLQPEITRRYNEANSQAELPQGDSEQESGETSRETMNSDEELSEARIREILGDNDFEPSGSNSLRPSDFMPGDSQDVLPDGGFEFERQVPDIPRQAGELDLNDLSRILGDDDFEPPVEQGEGSPRVGALSLDPDEVQDIRGDQNFDLENGGEPPTDTEELSSEYLRRVFGDNDFESVPAQNHSNRSNASSG